MGTHTITLIYHGDDSFLSATVTLDLDGAGAVTWAMPDLGADTHTIMVFYAGDGSMAPGRGSVVQVVVGAASVLVLITPDSPSVFGAAATLDVIARALAAPATKASGTVTFTEGDPVLGAVDLVDGHATFVLPALAVGDHAVTAGYGGDAQLAPATGTVTHVVTMAASALSIDPVGPTGYGEPAILVAHITTVAPAKVTPTGIITFTEEARVLGRSPVDSSGTATLPVGGSTVGDHHVVATYDGDDHLTGSTATAIHQVERGGTSVRAVASVSPAVAGRRVVPGVRHLRPPAPDGHRATGASTNSTPTSSGGDRVRH